MPTKILDGLDATSPLHEGPPLEMSSTPPLQCLFCRHLNPAGASFCNDCGSQLNLRPCDQCGAIDNRAAKNCYKCGAEFTLPAAPGLDAPLAPAILENKLIYPALNHANLAGPQAALPMDETASPEMGVTAPGSRRGTFVAVPALVLALLATSVYFYYARSGQLGPTPAKSTPSVVAAPIDTALSPTDTPPALATGTVAAEKAPSPAPPTVGTAPAVRVPSAPHAEVKTRQDPAIFEECPQAVATLGLCNPGPQQEGQ